MALIDQDATIRALVQLHEETGVKTAQAIRVVREMPEADAVEVVRCKDCKHWQTVVKNAKYGLCNAWQMLRTTGRDAYCSEARQRERRATMDDTISRQAVKYLDLFKKTYCRDESVKNDLVFRCNQCDFQLPDKTCLVKTMARKLCPDYKEFGSMGDLMGDSISRQAAINAVNDCGICIQKILDIPSVQTEQTTQTNTSNTLNALDCVSRQAAIDAICKHGTELERRGITVLSVANHKQATVDLLESLPSAQPEPRWIPIDGKEQLPRDGQRVLITDEDGEIEIACPIDYSGIGEDIEWWAHDYQCHPIAWCEIPTAYERSEE